MSFDDEDEVIAAYIAGAPAEVPRSSFVVIMLMPYESPVTTSLICAAAVWHAPNARPASRNARTDADALPVFFVVFI